MAPEFRHVELCVVFLVVKRGVQIAKRYTESEASKGRLMSLVGLLKSRSIAGGGVAGGIPRYSKSNC